MADFFVLLKARVKSSFHMNSVGFSP